MEALLRTFYKVFTSVSKEGQAIISKHADVVFMVAQVQ